MIFRKILNLFGGNKIPSGKKTGVIKFLNYRKGYGFIRSKYTQSDVYVHFQDARDRIHRGAKVKFDVERNEKGLRARNVEVVES
jgi:CspA family cold shock protein